VRTGRRLLLLLGVVLVAVGALVVTAPGGGAAGTAVRVRSVWLTQATPYRPTPPPGATDDYHCTLLDPHVTRAEYLIASEFFPGSREDHHAALYLLPASLVGLARSDGAVRHGWTCFGEGALPGAPLSDFARTTLLGNWSPGSGPNDFPRDTGLLVPAGSMIIMQVHYNLLVGDRPVRNRLVLRLVPRSTPLLPLHVQEFEAAPDLPCPSSTTGPLCSRAASLANLGRRFGPLAVAETNGIEALCGRDPADPPAGDSTSCTQPAATSGYLVRVAPHMHLLGVGFTLVVDPGTPEARTVLRVTDYDFHHQHSYNLARPVPVTAGEPVEITCTYDPTLETELPVLRRVAPHYVTWGDGSTDEMCVGVTWTSRTLPDRSARL
jgi:hypothetical protein